MARVASPDSPTAYTPPLAADVRCRNCEAPLEGPYCARCGQPDRPGDPTLRELLAELFAELTSVDGKLVATFRRLLTRPGALTLDHLAGRRASYLSPVRVYLTCSVVFFAISAVVPEPTLSSVRPELVGSAESPTAAALEHVRAMQRSDDALERYIGRKTEVAITHEAELHARLEDVYPRMMFVLVPLFGVLVAAFAGGARRYPAHLVFALHVHAFAFLALVLVELATATGSFVALAVATALAWCAVLVYLVAAMRRAYGHSLVAATVRTLGLAAVYALVLSAARLVVTVAILAML